MRCRLQNARDRHFVRIGLALVDGLYDSRLVEPLRLRRKVGSRVDAIFEVNVYLANGRAELIYEIRNRHASGNRRVLQRSNSSHSFPQQRIPQLLKGRSQRDQHILQLGIPGEQFSDSGGRKNREFGVWQIPSVHDYGEVRIR